MHMSARLALSLVALALCGAARAQAPATLDKVRTSGTMTVAYRESSIPFSYLGDNAQPTGFGWEICGRIVEQVKKATGRADLKVETQAVTSQNRIPLMQNGTIDIECGSTTNNSERAKQVAFAINYFYTGHAPAGEDRLADQGRSTT
jgi:glutamate/aspartate transport system substrate-binding protein